MKANPSIARTMTALVLAACGADPYAGGEVPSPPPSGYGPTSTTGSSTLTGFSPGSGGSSGVTTTGSIGVSGSGGAAGGGITKGAGIYTKAVVEAATPPPPISGGTLAIVAQGHKAVVADSDRDLVTLVDLDQLAVATSVALDKGDEPGRVIEDGAGRLHVALRGAGAIATFDAAGVLQHRTAVCNHPRGLAYDGASDVVHVACVGGELVTLPAAGGEPVRRLQLDRDLRDIVVDEGRLLVSRFRAAEVLVVESDGHVSRRLKPSPFTNTLGTPDTFSAAVAWRTVAAPGGGALMVLQEEQETSIVIRPGGYGSGCAGIVRSAVSVLRADGTGWTSDALATTLPVDVAVAADGSFAAVAGAGIPGPGLRLPMQSIVNVTVPAATTAPPPVRTADAGAAPSRADGGCAFGSTAAPTPPIVAVAFDAQGRLVAQTREPALRVGDHTIALPGSAIEDTGHELFHLATLGGIACASCHPEGHEDGHTWQFSGIGARRTQTIGGGILGTEPFHWDGDMTNFDTLAHQVFMGRMSGPQIQPEHIQALANWIDKIPAWKPAAISDSASVERGKVLFTSVEVGCAGCHAGTKMTNNATMNVGGGAVQVPSLRGVSYRAPFMHSGCALTLADRFGYCGGGELHGHTALLTAGQQSDLLTYLESL